MEIKKKMLNNDDHKIIFGRRLCHVKFMIKKEELSNSLT